jgi:hypothetical protein
MVRFIRDHNGPAIPGRGKATHGSWPLGRAPSAAAIVGARSSRWQGLTTAVLSVFLDHPASAGVTHRVNRTLYLACVRPLAPPGFPPTPGIPPPPELRRGPGLAAVTGISPVVMVPVTARAGWPCTAR